MLRYGIASSSSPTATALYTSSFISRSAFDSYRFLFHSHAPIASSYRCDDDFNFITCPVEFIQKQIFECAFSSDANGSWNGRCTDGATTLRPRYGTLLPHQCYYIVYGRVLINFSYFIVTKPPAPPSLASLHPNLRHNK